jgi:mannose-1-phosphate guanylyltransferase
MLHAVIMAGGSGTRFWPESRRNRPKQLLPITGGRAMLAETVERLDPLVPLERTWVVTNAQQVQGVRRVCPRLPVQNLLVEPVGRNTAPCVGLAAAAIAQEDPAALMAVLPADHAISPPAEFQRALRAAAQAADRPGAFVTFGILPSWPATGYGYIRRAARESVHEGLDCFRVAGFTEKPDAARAAEFLASGEYLWNSGIFVWRVRTILDAIREHMPALDAGLREIAAKFGEPGLQAAVDRVYPGLPAVPVDVGIMEKVRGVLVLSTPFRWSDVGSWKSLYDEVPRDEQGNAAVFPHGGMLLAEDARGVLAYSSEPQIVAALGVEDLVIVRTADAVLVARRDRSEEVKKFVDRLKAAGREDAT